MVSESLFCGIIGNTDSPFLCIPKIKRKDIGLKEINQAVSGKSKFLDMNTWNMCRKEYDIFCLTLVFKTNGLYSIMNPVKMLISPQNGNGNRNSLIRRTIGNYAKKHRIIIIGYSYAKSINYLVGEPWKNFLYVVYEVEYDGNFREGDIPVIDKVNRRILENFYAGNSRTSFL
jgi:hypothetical protein